MADKHLQKTVQNLCLVIPLKRYSKQKNRNYRNIRVVTLGQIYIMCWGWKLLASHRPVLES